jgi:hypothetical protein
MIVFFDLISFFHCTGSLSGDSNPNKKAASEALSSDNGPVAQLFLQKINFFWTLATLNLIPFFQMSRILRLSFLGSSFLLNRTRFTDALGMSMVHIIFSPPPFHDSLSQGNASASRLLRQSADFLQGFAFLSSSYSLSENRS